MARRNGGVKDLRLRNLDNKEPGNNDYSLDILIDVKEAMGANIINTVAERAKEIMLSMGIRTGISILSNYCVERRASSSFTIPV
jgi:hydroxymethylglutaryl-CoA reductase